MGIFDLFKKKEEAQATQPNNTATQGTRLLRRQSLVANILRACTHCGAPAKFISSPTIQTTHPGCYVSEDHPWHEMAFDDPCRACGCPGRFASSIEAKARYPEVFVKSGSKKEGKHIGKVCLHCKKERPGPECPNCGKIRPENENKGEIWIKEFY